MSTKTSCIDSGYLVAEECAAVAGRSEDGRSTPRLGDVGRSDSGEVEMTEFERAGPSSQEPAGTRAGESC